jgi:hypothetical protein
MNPDGIGYLYVADGFARGDWGTAINACWSPLYPALIALITTLVPPSAYWEDPMIHGVNFLCYLIAFAGFRFLLGALRRVARGNADGTPTGVTFANPIETTFAHIVFFCTALAWMGLENVTPDLLVAAAIYLLGGLALRLRQNDSVRGFAGLGAVAGIGYLVKAVMFPMGVLILIAASLTSGSRRITCRRAMFAFLGFIAVSAPQVAAVSKVAGHLTYSDTGGIVYARMVNQYPLFWTGKPEGSGTPLHGVRQISSKPEAFEFSTADIRSSHPVWDEPAYWSAGIKPHFDLSLQLSVTAKVLKGYLDDYRIILFTCLVLIPLARIRKSFDELLVLIIPAMAGFALYSLVYAEKRYLGGWAVVFLLGVMTAADYPGGAVRGVRSVMAALAIFLGVELTVSAWAEFEKGTHYTFGEPSSNPNLEAATRMRAMGLGPGSRVAVVGYGFDGYWARLGGIQIAMEAPDFATYWAADDSTRHALAERFREHGAVAIVSNRVPKEGPGPGWKTVGVAGIYVYPLGQAPVVAQR